MQLIPCEADLSSTLNLTWLLFVTVIALLLFSMFDSCYSQRKRSDKTESQSEQPEELHEDKTKLQKRLIEQEKKCNEEKDCLREQITQLKEEYKKGEERYAEKAYKEQQLSLREILALLNQKKAPEHAVIRPDSQSQSTQTDRSRQRSYSDNNLIERQNREIASLTKQHHSARADNARLRMELEKHDKSQNILENLLESSRIVEQKVNEISEKCQQSHPEGEGKASTNLTLSRQTPEQNDEHNGPEKEEGDDGEDDNFKCDSNRCHKCPWYAGQKHHICAKFKVKLSPVYILESEEEVEEEDGEGVNALVSVNAPPKTTAPGLELAPPLLQAELSSPPLKPQSPTANASETLSEIAGDVSNSTGLVLAEPQQAQEPDSSKPENASRIIEAPLSRLHPPVFSWLPLDRKKLTPSSQDPSKRGTKPGLNQSLPSPQVIEDPGTKGGEGSVATRPPTSSVEDEEAALANENELDFVASPNKSNDEPPVKGTVDQHPIILDVHPHTIPNDPSATESDREHHELPPLKPLFAQKPASNAIEPATPEPDARVEPKLSIINPEGQPEQPNTPTRLEPLSSSPGSELSDISSTVPPLPESDDAGKAEPPNPNLGAAQSELRKILSSLGAKPSSPGSELSDISSTVPQKFEESDDAGKADLPSGAKSTEEDPVAEKLVGQFLTTHTTLVSPSPPLPFPEAPPSAMQLFVEAQGPRFEILPTSGEGLLCGVRAVELTTAHMHPEIEGLTAAALMEVLDWQEYQDIVNDPGFTYDNEKDQSSTVQNRSHFSVDQLASMLGLWGSRRGLDLRLGVYREDYIPTVYGGYREGRTVVIWIHNDNNEERTENTMFPTVNHFSGYRRAPVDTVPIINFMPERSMQPKQKPRIGKGLRAGRRGGR
jgi:hypothetical protein